MGFRHRKITPRWPRANAEVERFMRTLGKAVRTAQMDYGDWRQELNRFLRHYRATPHSTTGVTPSELLNGRKLRTELPSVSKKKEDMSVTGNRLKERDDILKAYMKELADTRNHAKDSNIEVGDRVLVKRDERPRKIQTPLCA